MDMSEERARNPVVEAVRRARLWCETGGDPDDFRAFEAFVLLNDDTRTFEEVAAALDMSAPEVRRRVQRVRVRIREELSSLIGNS